MNGQPDPLTLEEHRQMSDELRRVSASLRELHRMAAEVYGDGSPAAARFGEAVDALASLRAEMKSQAEADLPPDGAAGLY